MKTMKFTRVRFLASLRIVSAVMLALFAIASTALAANVTNTWDANTGTAGAQDGSGTWDSGTNANWYNGTTDGLWPNTTSSYAFIGTNNGAAGTISVSGNVTVNTIDFFTPGSGSYTLGGSGTLLFGGSIPTIVISNSTTPIINTTIGEAAPNTPMKFLSGSSGAGTITVNGANTFTGSNSIVQCTVLFNSIANGGVPSSFGMGANTVPIVVGTGGSAAIATYTGTATSTDRPWLVEGTSASITINSSGTGGISFNNTNAVMAGAVGARTLILGGSYAGTNTFAELVSDLGTGANITTLKIGNTTAAASYWNLTGPNTHSGGTILNSSGTTAVLGIGNASALGTGALTIGANDPFDNTTGGPITVNNALTLSGGSPTFIGSSSMTFNGAVTLSGAANRTITVTTNTLTLGGQITGTNLSKAGAGTLVLNNSGTPDTHSGTSISAGILDLGGTTQTLGAVAVTAASTIQNGTVNGSNYLVSLTTGIANLTANLAGSNVNLTLSNSGTQTPTLVLFGSNSYSGTNLLIGGGTILLTNDSGLGFASAPIVFGTNTAIAATNNAAPTSNTVVIGSARTITVSNNVTANFVALDTNNLTVAALITGPGNVFRKGSSFTNGAVRFANDSNSFTGDFSAAYGNTEFTSVANQGTVSSLGGGASATGGQIVLTNSTSSGTLRYVGASNSATLRPLVWGGTTATYALDASGAGTIQFLATGTLKAAAGSAELRLRGTNTGSNILAQVINNNGGATSVTKLDSGTWILTGTETYSGPTGIGSTGTSGGTLLVNGTLQSSNALTVTNGILGGTGTIYSPIVVQSAGILAPGALSTPGVLHATNSLALSGTASLRINKSGASDQVTGLNTITNGGTLTVTNVGPALAAGDAFTLFSAGTYFGSFAVTNLPPLAAGLVWDTSLLASSGIISVGQLPAISSAPTNVVAQCTGNAAFNVAATGSSALSYQWSVDGSAISGATGTSFVLTNVHSSATVSVTVSNPYGTVSTNAVLTVVDTIPPMVTLNGSSSVTVECHGSYTELGATAFDSCAGSLTPGESGSVDTTTPGIYVLTYTATDPSGNIGTATRTVTVSDTTAPMISYYFTNLVLTAGTNCSALMPDVTGTNYIIASDTCSGTNIIITQTPTNNALLPVGTNLVVLAVADLSGNTTFSTNTIIVMDATSLALTSSANPALPAANVVFTAMLSFDSPCATNPTGGVIFSDGTNALGTVTVDSSLAALTNSSLSHGYHVITAVYSGDGAFIGSTNTLTQLINTPPLAGPAAYSRQQDLGLQINVTDLLTNATDADGDIVTLVSVAPASTNGAVISLTNGVITYTPPATNANVTDSFSYTVTDTFGATSTGMVTVTILPEGPVTISGFTELSDGSFQLNFTGSPGHTYFIQATASLIPTAWINLSTNVADTNGLFQYVDLDATNYSTRYYRTSVP